MARADLADSIKAYVKTEPRHFADVVETFRRHPYREVLKAWSDIRIAGLFDRDREGRYLIKEE
jgi:hypothetical protein